MSARPYSKQIIVLDRDGTIVVDRGYLSDPSGLEFLPGAADGLRLFYDHGFKLVIVTNQSGIGRGLFSVDRLEEIHNTLRGMTRAIGAPVEQIYYCPHVPEDNCNCRKPSTGLLLRAAAELHFDPSDAIVIGDQPTDIELGHRVGAKTVLISQSQVDSDGPYGPELVAINLLEAARAIQEYTESPR